VTEKERVIKAIEFDKPDRVPIYFCNRDHERGDIMAFGLSLEDNNVSEWGYKWTRLDDGTMGQPEKPIIKDWGDLDGYRFPQLNRARRIKDLEEFKKRAGKRYLLAALGITGFNIYMFIRGFQNAMMDFADQTSRSIELLDGIFSFESELIRLAAEEGFDGVHFADDWGTQEGLIISPALWRKIFKNRYKKQFDYAHNLGLTVWFHCCGNIISVVPDFHEIGVDVMNISQPNVVDISRVGSLLKGKQCFMMPISYQTVSISGTPEDIKAETRRLYTELGTENGGFIGYVEDYSCMGMSEENFEACVKGFKDLI
jgi:uroporphyrinogen decarboxylase